MRDPLVVVAMLRFIVLIALVAGSIHAAPILNSSPFIEGKTAHFKYHFQHVFSNPLHSKIFAILSVESDLLITKSHDWLEIKLANVSVAPLQTKINELNPLWRMVTKETTAESLNAVVKKVKASLEIPIKFQYGNGIILSIMKDPLDIDESVNIKRGLMSHFEMNLKPLESKLKTANRHGLKSRIEMNEKVYLEKNVQGLCKTNYVFIKNASNPKDADMVKTLDLNNCIVAPKYWNGSILMPKSLEWGPKLKMLETWNTIRYKLKFVNNAWSIERAISESSYNVLLNTPSEGRITLNLNQTLWYVRMATESVKSEGTVKVGLIAQLPVHNTPAFSVEKMTIEIINMIRGDITAKQINNIILWLERFQFNELRKIWDSCVERRSLVLDIFTKVDSVYMRKFLITFPFLESVVKHPSALSELALFQSPDEDLLNYLVKMIKVGRLTEEQRKHLIIVIGAYAHKFVMLLHKIEKEIEVGDELIKRAEKDMAGYPGKLEDVMRIWHAEKVLKWKVLSNLTKCLDKTVEYVNTTWVHDPESWMVSIGNMGYNKTVDCLLNIIKNKTISPKWRMMAIDSLRKMPNATFHKLIEMPLLHVFANMSEWMEIRMRAFLLMTKFELSETTVLALLLNDQNVEPKNETVLAFVYKYWSQISKSVFWPLNKMSAKAEKVVTTVEPILPVALKERMTLSHIYENAHRLWRSMSSLLVWHWSVSSDASLSSAALDLQILPGINVSASSIKMRVRTSSLNNYDDVAVEVHCPFTVEELVHVVMMRNWTALNKTMIVLKRNDLVLRNMTIPSVLPKWPEILSLVWRVNERIIPTASGGFLRVVQKSSVVAPNPWHPATKNVSLTSECLVNAYVDAYFFHLGGGMRTSVKLLFPGKVNITVSNNTLAIETVMMPTKKIIKPVSIEQVPYTMARVWWKDLVDVREMPLSICEHATAVSYIEVWGNFSLRADLPMKTKSPVEIWTAVWYGIHAINLFYKDVVMAERKMKLEWEVHTRNESDRYSMDTIFRWNNKTMWSKNVTVMVMPSESEIVGRIIVDIGSESVNKSIAGEIKIPKRKMLPAKCLFAEEYQNRTKNLLRKVEMVQPCMIRSQIQTMISKFERTWNKLISVGLLNLDQTTHNVIAELSPELITDDTKLPIVEQLFRHINISKKVKDFNDAAFHPMDVKYNKIIKELSKSLLEAHKNLSILIESSMKWEPVDIRNITYHYAALFEMLSIQEVTVKIFLEALHKTSSVHLIPEELFYSNVTIREEYRKLAAKYNVTIAPQLKNMLITINQQRLFGKIEEVEDLMLFNGTQSVTIRSKVSELLALLPKNFDPESKIAEILFIRARHLVSGSIVFRPLYIWPANDTLYEFWHLRQDIVMFFTLKRQIADILPCDMESHKEMCEMLGWISKEFTLFHYAAAYKRVALRYFNTKPANSLNINKLMSEFDNLLRVIQIISAELKEKTKMDLEWQRNMTSTYYRITAALEWSIKLLDEYRSIWHNIKQYGMKERAEMVDKMSRRVITLWNNLKVKESCKIEHFPMPMRLREWTPEGECSLPESMKIVVRVWMDAVNVVYAELKAKKSFEQLIFDHQQIMPGFRSETAYRFLEKYGLGINGSIEEYDIMSNINVYRDLRLDVTVQDPNPMPFEVMRPVVGKQFGRWVRWILRKWWEIEEMKSEEKEYKPVMGRMANLYRLPTVRVLEYMDNRMVDVVVIHPNMTESFLELPVVLLPLLHWPIWSEGPIWNVTTTPIYTTTPWEISTPNVTTPWEISTPNVTTPWEVSTPNVTTPWEVSTPNMTTPWEVSTPNVTTPWEVSTPNVTTPWEVSTPNMTTPWEVSTPNVTTPWEVSTPNMTTPWEVSTPNVTTPWEVSTPNVTTPWEVSTPNVTTPWEEISTPNKTTFRF